MVELGINIDCRDEIFCCEMSPSGKLIAVGTNKGITRVFDVEKGKLDFQESLLNSALASALVRQSVLLVLLSLREVSEPEVYAQNTHQFSINGH